MANWAGSEMEPRKDREMDSGTDLIAGASEDKCSSVGAAVESFT